MATNHCDKEYITIDKKGTLDKNEDGELVLYIQLKEETKEYKINDLLERMIGTTVQFKSVSDEE